jgi:tetratricopeptide (TPR) repeat protein
MNQRASGSGRGHPAARKEHFGLAEDRVRRRSPADGNGDARGAEEYCRHRVEPVSRRSHYNLGTPGGRAGSRRATCAFIRIEQSYAPEVHFNLGVLYLQTDRLQDAAGDFEAAVKGRGEFLEAHHNLAEVYRRLGREADARREEAVAERLRRARPRADVHLLTETI